ncbi:MAG: OmpA family protein [Alphaproteobacteria bacterium]|nr:OmpA family protein [Alphaproteobacteria bacterium]
MRAAAVISACVAVLLSTASWAQERPTRSVDDYLCTFAGKCSGSDADQQASRDAPETKGFRLIRPTGEAPHAASPKPAAAPAGNRTQTAAVTRTVRSPQHPRAVSAHHYAASAKAKGQSLVGRRGDLLLSFESGSANLTLQAKAEAKVFAETLLRPELSGRHFLIEGHTDSVGGRSYNLVLSQRRAEAVAAYLVSLGIERDRLQARGFGFDRPLQGLAPASSENRRVEAMLTR